MQNYTVLFEEVNHYEFSIESESFDTLSDDFSYAADSCQLDFGKGYPVHSSITEVECEETGVREKWFPAYVDLERFVEQFKSYVRNDAEAADPEYILEALQQAGCTDQDIKSLGFEDIVLKQDA